MPTKNKVSFSISREDLLYNYASTFKDVFEFSYNGERDFSTEPGVRLQEALGFDFQNETSPVLKISELSKSLIDSLDESPSKFSVYISLEDIALGVRKVIFSKRVDELSGGYIHKINLDDFTEFGYFRGYIVKCFIARNSSVDPKESKYWSKSNILYQSDFIVKATADEALFEIAWTDFSDQNERKNLLYLIDWVSNDVSHESHSQTFQVVANNDLKSQFKRLENNKLFGGLAVRLIVDRIISELAETTLRCADLGAEPLEGSLHEKMLSLFADLGLDFVAESKRYQNGDNTEVLNVKSRMNKVIQSKYNVAATLKGIKFGGFRP